MIIKVDHVALSSLDFSSSASVLAQIGYKQVFDERNLPNLRIKKGLMKKFSEKQDLSLFESQANIGIELLNHNYVSQSNGFVTPVFENIPKNLVEFDKKIIVGKLSLSLCRLNQLNALACVENNLGKNFAFKKLLTKTPFLEKSIAFWELLGFKKMSCDEKSASLVFNSLVSKQVVEIYLQEDKKTSLTPLLDDRGFNCIAFVSNSAKNEKERFSEKGFKTTEIEPISVNNKLLHVFFVHGSCGELVEIIGIKN